MKIRKIDSIGEPHTLCLAEMSAIGRTIVALDRAQNSTAPAVEGSQEFQRRCSDAIVALTDYVLRAIESYYVPETKKFLVTYDVKRSGTGELVVEAKDEAEAKAKAESQLRNDLGPDWLDKRETEFVAADIVGAEEYRDGQA